MTLDPWIHELIPFILACAGAISWFIRLEAKVLSTDKAQVDLEKTVDKLDTLLRELDNRIVEKLSFIERSLAKIEGRLSIDTEKSN